MRRLAFSLLATLAFANALPAFAQEALVVRPLAERKVTTLPESALFWRIDVYPSAEAARAAAGGWSLVAEAAGRVCLFTLGGAGGSSSGGETVATVGPIARIDAAEYLLRINEASGPPGSVTPVHSHPGSEAFYVLTGEQSIRGAHGTIVVRAGMPEAGHGASEAMQVSSSGTSGLDALVMFVVDATKPFSSPASLPSSGS